MAALLSAESARIDVAGVPAIDGATFATTGDFVLVLGAARALFEAAAGLRACAHGEVRIQGTAAIEAVRTGLAAGAQLDPPMPPSWTLMQYVAWSARLAGHARRDAFDRAREAIGRMQLASMAATKLGRAPLASRRGAVIAAALATGAAAIVVDDPTSGLTQEQAGAFARLTVRALAGRRSLVFAARVPLESPLAIAADEALVVSGSVVVAQGAPAEIAANERVFALRVKGDAGALAAAIEAGGGRVLCSTAALASVDLGPLTTRDLLRLADESHTVVVELRPLARGFA